MTEQRPPFRASDERASTSRPKDGVVTQHDCPDCRCQQRAEADAFMEQLARDDGRRSPTGNCWDVEDGMDGFFVHAEACPQVGIGWTGGFGCIRLRRWKGQHEAWMERAS